VRSLSAGLLAAQKAASGVPYVRTILQNTIRNIRHLIFAQTYSDAGGDTEHDAAGDNTYLHRVRISAGNAQYQRDPSASWTTLSSAATATVVALAVINNTRVFVVYNDSTGGLFFRESTDQGANFGAETSTTATGGVAPKALTVQYKTTGGDLCIVWEQSNTLKRIRRTSGTFGAVTTWTQTAASINGCKMLRNGDFHIVVTGTESTTLRPTLWSLVLGDGVLVTTDTWTQFFIQQQAETDEPVTFAAPFIARPDTTRVTFVEKFTGTPAYTRTYITMQQTAADFSPGAHEWLDPIPLDNTTNFGYAIAHGGASKAWYSRPAQVLEASSTAVSLDMSANLIEATIEELDGLHQQAHLTFDNSNAQYAGPPSPIALGRDVVLGLGYDAAFSTIPRQYITGWQYTREGGKSLFTLHTRGVDHWLAQFAPRSSIVVAASPLTRVARGTAGRAGIDSANNGNSSRSANFNVTWTIHPHRSHLHTILALLDIMPDVFFTQTTFITLNEPLASDGTDYTYGTDHLIYTIRARNHRAPAAAEVFGAGVLGQAFDFAAQNHDKPLQDRRRDANETAAADANAVAAARLRKAVLTTDKGELTTPPNCGIEVNDVIAYTDTFIHAAQQTARVRGITTRFRRAGTGRLGALPTIYEQTLKLGGV